jgi:hypothetical protein
MEGINEDSMRMIKASKFDWIEFDNAYSDLKKTLISDDSKNAESYIDTTIDLLELGMLNQTYFYNTSKMALKQLTANIQVLNQLLTTPIREKNSVKVLSMLMQNIDALVTKYIATKGSVYYILKTVLPDIKLTVVDKTAHPLGMFSVILFLIKPAGILPAEPACRHLNRVTSIQSRQLQTKLI